MCISRRTMVPLILKVEITFKCQGLNFTLRQFDGSAGSSRIKARHLLSSALGRDRRGSPATPSSDRRPACWQIRSGQTGHFEENVHITEWQRVTCRDMPSKPLNKRWSNPPIEDIRICSLMRVPWTTKIMFCSGVIVSLQRGQQVEDHKSLWRYLKREPIVR